MNNAARYFLYARKSTDDKTRQIRSIGDQIAEARELAAREKLTIAREFVEKQSAKAPGRPIFNEMLDRIERGEADGIIAWAPDRLTRNPLDAGRLSYLVQIGMIQDLRFPTHTFERSANGKFVLNLLFSQSQLYINSLSENITRGKRQKVKSGIWPQEAPIGYRNDKATRTITPDPITGPLIVKMFELYATGQYGFRELRNLLVEMGLVSPRGHPPAVCKIQHALENPIYYGLIRYKDEFYEGKHKPLITQKLFDECRRVMHTRGRTKSKNQIPFLYRGQIRCDSCGCMITLEQQRQYRYVRCTHGKGSCAQPYLREERLIELIDRSIGLLAISETTAEEILAEVDRRAAIATDTTKSECDKLHAEITACDERLSRLLAAYLDAAISVEEYRVAKNDLVSKKHALAEKLAETERRSFDTFEIMRRQTKSLLEATYVLKKHDPAESWRFFKSLALNMSLRDRVLKWEPRADWQLLLGQGVVELGGAGPGSDLERMNAQDREGELKRSTILDMAGDLR